MKNGNKLICLVFVFSIIGWIYPSTTNTGVQWVVNNTNLAPFVAGHGGTGERIGDNTTYWANNSPIQIFLWSHANTTGADAEIHLYINGSKVADTSGRPLGVAEQSNKTVVATIPQYANYSVEMVNFHHYEWREYPILTGEVTTNITTTSTGTGAGCEGNCSFDGVWMNSIRKNNTSDAYGGYINLSAPFGQYGIVGSDIFTHFTMHTGDYYTLQSTNTTSGNYSIITGTSEGLTIAVTDGLSNNWIMSPEQTRYLIDTREYILNQSELSLGGANLTNINNINNTMKINTSRYHWNNDLTYYSNASGSQKTSNEHLFDYLFQEAKDGLNGNNLISYQTISNTSGSFNFFQFRKARGEVNVSNNSAILEPMQTDDTLGRLVGSGWNGDAWSGSSAIIDFTADGNFTPTSMPMRLDFWSRDASGGPIKRLSIFGNGTIRHYNLVGAGNAYICVDADGDEYRGSPGC